MIQKRALDQWLVGSLLDIGRSSPKTDGIEEDGTLLGAIFFYSGERTKRTMKGRTTMGVELQAFHVVTELRPDRDKELGRKLLNAFAAKGYLSLYGETVKLHEQLLNEIPFRPLVEMTGCETFINPQRGTVLLCKVPSPLSRRLGRYIDFIIIDHTGIEDSVIDLQDIIHAVTDEALTRGLFDEVSSDRALRKASFPLSPSGKLLKRKDVFDLCMQMADSFHTPTRKEWELKPKGVPQGIWLEALTHKLLTELGQPNHVGIMVGDDEIDVLMDPFGQRIAIECKDSSLKGNDVSIFREKLRRCNCNLGLIIVTQGDIHPNASKETKVWLSDEDLVPSTGFELPTVSVTVANSACDLKKFLSNFVKLAKWEVVQLWLMMEDSSPIIPWFKDISPGAFEAVRAYSWYRD